MEVKKLHYSVKTVKPPEFLNLQQSEINPLISSCEIKVLYVGENRNKTSFSKATASKMAKTLRGSMIVGYYKKDKQDFSDHGQVVTIDDSGVHFECKTTPYGFVAPDARVWFQTFNEVDSAGNEIEREYLMTTGYLWTQAFPEAKAVIEEGRPQSMELEKHSVSGQWTKSLNHDYEIFIVNDAVFSKLCILGDDVEPCFEGAAVTKPEISASFTLDEEFQHSLYTMMKDLREVLQGGNSQMDKDVLNNEASEVTAATQFAKEEEEDKKKNAATEDKEDKNSVKEKKDEGEKETPAAKDDEEKKKKEQFSLNTVSLDEYNKLRDNYTALEKQYNELVEFKAGIEREQKKSLIGEFTMLADEDKAEVLSNIDKYTLDEIESKLAVICFRKKVNFVSSNVEEIESTVEETQADILTYTLNETSEADSWIKAVEARSMN